MLVHTYACYVKILQLTYITLMKHTKNAYLIESSCQCLQIVLTTDLLTDIKTNDLLCMYVL